MGDRPGLISRRLLVKAKALEIILALTSALNTRELREETGGSYTTIALRVEELVKEDLIYQIREETWPFKKTVALTEKGWVLRAILKEFMSVGDE